MEEMLIGRDVFNLRPTVDLKILDSLEDPTGKGREFHVFWPEIVTKTCHSIFLYKYL